jgi:integrase
MLGWAVRAGCIDFNPAAGVRKPAAPRASDRVLSDPEIVVVWNALSSTKQKILQLLLLTGQRVGEVIGMRRDEIDLEARTWTLPGKRTKNGFTHTVPLTAPAIDIINQGIAGAGDSVFVFGSDTPSPAALGSAIRRTLSEIAHWSLHDLRRTVLTRLAEMGIAPFVIGSIANHRTTTRAGVTFANYVHYKFEPEKRQALEAWADRLLGIVKGNAND